MKTILKTYACLLCALLAGSCVKDNTNTDFRDLNEVTIAGIADEYTVPLFSLLEITPTITTTFDDESNLDFAWYIYDNKSYLEADTISRTKNLSAEIANQVPGQEYWLELKVTDRTTGIFYTHVADFRTTSTFTTGTMILGRTGTQNEVHFIDPAGTLYTDIYTKANDNQPLPGNPTAIFLVDPNKYQTAKMKRVYIMSDDPTGGAIVDPVSFKRDTWLRDGFMIEPSYETYPTLAVSAYHKGTLPDYLIINGKVFNRGANMGDPLWKAELIRTTEPTSYEVAPYFICYAGRIPVFYDNLNGRFLAHFTANKGVLQIYTGGDKTHFDYENVGLEMIHAGALSQATYFYGLFRNDAGNRYLLKWSANVIDNFKTAAKVEITPAMAPHLAGATCFMRNDPALRSFMFYASGGAVYAIDTDNVTAGVPCEIKLADLSADGFTVDCLSHHRQTDPETADFIRIGVSKAGQRQGGIIFMQATTTGGLNLKELSRTVGICDKVVSIAEKIS